MPGPDTLVAPLLRCSRYLADDAGAGTSDEPLVKKNAGLSAGSSFAPLVKKNGASAAAAGRGGAGFICGGAIDGAAVDNDSR
jgi:hypothetical protein